MSDLIERLRAALDAEEQTAKAVDSADWDDTLNGTWNEFNETTHAHIGRHDPARVLAMVKAHRKIIELAAEATGLDAQVDDGFRVGTRDVTAEPYLGDVILRALAEAYGIEIK